MARPVAEDRAGPEEPEHATAPKVPGRGVGVLESPFVDLDPRNEAVANHGDAVKIQVRQAVPPVGLGFAVFHSLAPHTMPCVPVGLAAGSGAAPE